MNLLEILVLILTNSFWSLAAPLSTTVDNSKISISGSSVFAPTPPGTTYTETDAPPPQGEPYPVKIGGTVPDIELNVGNSNGAELSFVSDTADVNGDPIGIDYSGLSSYNQLIGSENIHKGSRANIGNSHENRASMVKGEFPYSGTISNSGISMNNFADLSNGFNGTLALGETKNVTSDIRTGNSAISGYKSGSIRNSGISVDSSYKSPGDQVNQKVDIASSLNSFLYSATGDAIVGDSGDLVNHRLSSANNQQ